MLKYVLKRLLMLIPVILGVMLIIFIFQAISGDDPVKMLLGIGTTDEKVAELTRKMGLDKPVYVQFFKYLWNFFTKGDLGTSYATNRPVLSEIMARFPYTAFLAVGSVIIGVLIGVPLGILSAVKQYSWMDNGILGFSVFMSSFPPFWLALLLIVGFSVRLKWFPANGLATPAGWVLPIFCVSLGATTGLTRTTRSSMLETIRQDYVRTARAKGQKESKVILKHVVRNSLIPVINAVGITIGVQLGGSLIIETIFGIPGVGQYAVSAINNRNYPAVIGSVVILAFLFSLITLLVDICYVAADPRLIQTFTREATMKKHIRMMKRQQRKLLAHG
jgi:peptide/nickel transport system permease protein